ncbi:apolipoprotein N-acyltransferase [Candidatus Gullanella endobia]|uniref:apolipoprotein N-acyltransferase n=1 Tax=Candidatus Gullanella endobia TaxID=1070130 RepID=UPI002A4E2CCD|nr:apolipoprotein N-acyltransferase [Candidatus Gullanella endobia]
MNTSLFTQQWFRILLALVTGACGTIAFSPYNFWPSAIISLGGLLLVTLNRNVLQASCLGFFWGFSLFGTGINWIYVSIAQFSGLPDIFNVILVIILITYLALYPMLFSILLIVLWPRVNFCRLVLGAPVLLLVTEFLRSRILTGFPWLEFGYSQIDGPLKGIAPLLGVQAITFILMVISGLSVYAIEKRRLLPAVAVLTILVLLYPLYSLHWYEPQPERAIDVTLVQGNIAQSIKWEAKQVISTLDIYLQHTLKAIGKSKIVIWPESAIPENEMLQNDFLTKLDKQLKKGNTRLVTGIIDARPTINGYHYYNSIIVLGESIPYRYPSKNRYNKHHLVPFGEIIPCSSLFRLLSSLFNFPIFSLSQGDYLQPQLRVANMNLTATICYEIILGSQVRDNFHSNTDFLLTILNDAWFGHSIGPWQHFQMARMRSLELGRPLLHSSNNGITAVIDATGMPQAQLPQFKCDVLNIRVIPTKGMTPYARVGSWPLWIFTILVGVSALVFDHFKQIKFLI